MPTHASTTITIVSELYVYDSVGDNYKFKDLVLTLSLYIIFKLR